MLMNKFIVGDIVKCAVTDTIYRINWINHERMNAGCSTQESRTGEWTGNVYQLAELEMVTPSIHIRRPLKPINEMTEDELREQVRILREGRQESLVNYFAQNAKKSTSKKSRKKTASAPAISPESFAKTHSCSKALAKYVLADKKRLAMIDTMGMDFVKTAFERSQQND